MQQRFIAATAEVFAEAADPEALRQHHFFDFIEDWGRMRLHITRDRAEDVGHGLMVSVMISQRYPLPLVVARASIHLAAISEGTPFHEYILGVSHEATPVDGGLVLWVRLPDELPATPPLESLIDFESLIDSAAPAS